MEVTPLQLEDHKNGIDPKLFEKQRYYLVCWWVLLAI